MRYRYVALLVVLGCTVANPAPAQQQGPQYPSPRLFTVNPPGGKIGSVFEVTVGGADLDDVTALYFSNPKIKADRILELGTLGRFVANKLRVTIAADAPVGIYDVRAIGRYGISNPRGFAVGDLNEIAEKEPNNDVPQAHKIEINSTVNGAIQANTDVDYFAFAGKKGQRIIVSCAATSLDSRLEPFIQLYDAKGKLLASNRRYYEKDAVLDVTLTADADYFVRLSQHAHIAGGPEYYYRLTISQTPWIDAAYPPVVEAGKATAVMFYGRNLPNGQPDPKALLDGRPLDKLTQNITPSTDPMSRQRLNYFGAIAPERAALDGFEHRVKNASGISNPILLTYASAPVVLDNENNDTSDKAQEVPVPCEICGRIEKRGDRDRYVFTGKANDAYMLEVFADRLGSPIDVYFEIWKLDAKDPKNRQLVGEFDDNTDILSPVKFNNRTDDPKARFVVPSDSKYELMISSRTAEIQFGPRDIYRLSIRKEVPDFRLILLDDNDVNPDALSIHQGSGSYLQVLCSRQDGFTGEVTVTVEGLPAGVTCPPQVLGANMKQTGLVFTAAADAAPWAGEIKIKGTANINGSPVVREARGGCMIWPVQPQQNIPALCRLSQSICLSVREKATFTIAPNVSEAAVPAGGTLTLKVKVTRVAPDMKAQVQLLGVELPPNLAFNNNNQPVNVAPDKTEADVVYQVRAGVAPGTYNLVLRGSAQVPFTRDPMGKNKQNVNVTEVAVPIKLTVFNTAAEVTVSNPNVTIKAGTDMELVVKVNRLNNYKGEFKVQLVLPSGFQGVSAAEVTIPANANEAKLMLKAAANAAPMMNPGVVVKAVATIDKVTLNHEAKFAVAIVK